MSDASQKEELLRLIRQLMSADLGPDEQGEELLLELERRVPHPRVSDFIFHPETEMSAEEILERALAYEPLAPPAAPREPEE